MKQALMQISRADIRASKARAGASALAAPAIAAMAVMAVMIMSAVFPIAAEAQNNSYNYIASETMLNEEGTRKAISVQYFDGLGRPELTVSNALSAQGQYLHTAVRYDALSRVVEEWLPAPVTNAPEYIMPDVVMKAAIQTHQGDSVPYTSYEYDAFGRMLSSRRPGAQWAGKRAAYVHRANIFYNCINRYRADESGSGIHCDGYINPGTLKEETAIDEDGKKTTVYYNIYGQKILERRADRNDTYFVYDERGLLRFVLTPMYQKNADLDKYAYEYRYDALSRCVYKKLPGCKPVRYWYDNADRVAFVQDGELLDKQQCRFFLYDRFGRPVMQGLCINPPCNVTSAVAEFRKVEDWQDGSGYVADIMLISPVIEKISYYDNYECLSTEAFAKCPDLQRLRNDDAVCATGMTTGCIEYTTDHRPLFSVFYYDTKERICDVRQSGLDGKQLRTRTAYSFTGKPLRVVYELRDGGRTDTLTCRYSYSPSGSEALTDAYISLNGAAPRKVKKLEYDDWGRITANTLPEKAGKLTYSYDIRDHVTYITGTGMEQGIGYDGLANGNIRYVSNSYNIYPNDGDYGDLSPLPLFDYYEYDDMNRLVSSKAYFSKRCRDEETTYDENGNILTLKRSGQGHEHGYLRDIDNLTYSYDGNRLIRVTDTDGSAVFAGSFDFKPSGSADLYLYNSNGAMTRDPNKGMSIEYADNGTPRTIRFDNGNSISYIYGADGEKLKTEWTSRGDAFRPKAGTTTGGGASAVPAATNSEETFGPFVYIDGRLAEVRFDDGYCTIDSSGRADYHYYVRDYMESVCVVTDDDGNIEQQNAYYAWGGIYSAMSVNPSLQDRKYSGKPFDRRHGLDLYDYGARRYDPALARWTSPDPLCEYYYNISPYAFVNNNPIIYIDPDGKDSYYNEAGDFLFKNLKKTDIIYIVSDYSFSRRLEDGTMIYKLWNKRPLEESELTAKAYSNIFTNIMQRYGYDTKKLFNGKVSVCIWDDFRSNLPEGAGYNNPDNRYGAYATATPPTKEDVSHNRITAFIFLDDNLLTTESNIINMLGVHEYTEHFIKGIGDENHWLILQKQREDPSWINTTHAYKEHFRHLERIDPDYVNPYARKKK